MSKIDFASYYTLLLARYNEFNNLSTFLCSFEMNTISAISRLSKEAQGPLKWPAEERYIRNIFLYNLIYYIFCSRRIEAFITYVRPMQLPETSITRRLYKSTSTSNRRLIVSNRGRAK